MSCTQKSKSPRVAESQDGVLSLRWETVWLFKPGALSCYFHNKKSDYCIFYSDCPENSSFTTSSDNCTLFFFFLFFCLDCSLMHLSSTNSGCWALLSSYDDIWTLDGAVLRFIPGLSEQWGCSRLCLCFVTVKPSDMESWEGYEAAERV